MTVRLHYSVHHRIREIAFRRKGRLVTESVGASAANGESVIAIFKNDMGYFVCTYSQGTVGGESLTVRSAEITPAEAFEPDEFN